jgi:hypothetical protein
MLDKDKTCGACQNMEAYWAEKARLKAEAEGGIKDQIERSAHAPIGGSAEDEACGPECAEDAAEVAPAVD